MWTPGSSVCVGNGLKALEDSLGSVSYLLALPLHPTPCPNLLYRQEGTLTVVWAGLPQAYSPPRPPDSSGMKWLLGPAGCSQAN